LAIVANLVAGSVRIVSAAGCVICSGSGSADGSSTHGSAYRHPRAYTIIAATIVGSTVSATTVNATAIYTAVIYADTSSIVCGGVS
jgi:hypothetical protein